MKQASGRFYCRKRWPAPVADLLWLCAAGRELTHLVGRRHWAASRHQVLAVWRVARGHGAGIGKPGAP